METTYQSSPILIKKIKATLFSFGLNEKFVAFDYLTLVLAYFIEHKDDSQKNYKTALNLISNQFNRTHKTICQAIGNLLKNLKNKEIIARNQFNISANKTLNKIRVIKGYIENKL